MTEQQQPPSGSRAPSPAPEPTAVESRREPEKPRKFEAPDGVEDSGRFAAYDTTLGKYVGGVHDTKTKARDAGKASGAESFEVVEV